MHNISGYGSIFYDGSSKTEYQLFPGAVERVMPGAFHNALRNGDDVLGLFNHDANQLLGRLSAGTMTLREDRIGLKYEITTPPTHVGADVATHVEIGNINGASFSFAVVRENWRTEADVEIREIEEVVLYDVGPVVSPAYTGTTAEVGDGDGTPSGRKKATKSECGWLALTRGLAI